MTVETATYINGLNASYPASGDQKSEGDNHMRLIKSTLKATFPNISGAVSPTHLELNYVAGVTSAIQDQINRTLRQSGGSAVSAIPDAATRASKVLGFDASGNPVTTIANADLASAITAAGNAATSEANAAASAAAAAASAASVDAAGIAASIATKTTGPASATDNAIARFDATTGKLLQNSPVTVSDTGNVAGVASMNGGQLAGLRNRIINGHPIIAQRGTSFASPATDSYTLDRWRTSWNGAAVSISQVSGTGSFKYAMRMTGAAGNTGANVIQRIESANVSDLVGKTVTLSARLVSSSPQTVAWVLNSANSTDNFSGVAFVATGTWSVTSTATDFSAVISSLPAGVANGLQLTLWAQNTGAFTSGTLDITGVQLEVGSVATPFEHRPIGMELALCQRYYETGSIASSSGLTAVISAGSAYKVNDYSFAATKRSTPTVTLSNLTYVQATTATVADASVASFSVYVTASFSNSNVRLTTGDFTASSEL